MKLSISDCWKCNAQNKGEQILKPEYIENIFMFFFQLEIN